MFTKEYFQNTATIAKEIDIAAIELMVDHLVEVRKNKGRLFILGVGGSAANASHATNDFRKLASLESYCPTDNVSEITARTNDEGWENIFVSWLKTSKLSDEDAVLIFSVGGGDRNRGVSINLCNAIDYAKEKNATILSIVGKLSGYAVKKSDVSIVVPEIQPLLTTPLSESFQALIWHCLVSHPKLKMNETTW